MCLYREGYTVKFFFPSISWNTNLTSISQCTFRYQENCPLENCPPENYPHQKISPYESSPCENCPPEYLPRENYPQWNPLSTYKSYKWMKKQNYKIFCLEETCAIQHPYQNNKRPFWYTDDLTENTALRYFLDRVKKIQKSNESANHQVAFTFQLHESRRTD